MRRSIIWLALACSVLFNLFFAAGYMKTRNELAMTNGANGANGVAQQVAAELDLDSEQAALFAELRSEFKVRDTVYTDGLALVHQELEHAMSAEEPDSEQIQQLIEHRADLEHQRRVAGAEHFGAFFGALKPEQRHRLSRRFHDRGPRGEGRRRQLMERFDEDRDGRLDEVEEANAQQFIDSQRRRWEERREVMFAEMFDRFDANGDGVLDQEEAAAWHEQMRERRRGGRRPDRPGESRGPRGPRDH